MEDLVFSCFFFNNVYNSKFGFDKKLNASAEKFVKDGPGSL